MIRAVLVGFAMAVAAPAAHAQVNWDIEGSWSGGYVCNQGVTDLHLLIERDGHGDGVNATFRFSPDKSNPRVPSGAFRMHGSFDPAAKRLRLHGVSWIKQPRNYVMVDLDGWMRGSGIYISGDVAGVGCTHFDVIRDDPKLVG